MRLDHGAHFCEHLFGGDAFNEPGVHLCHSPRDLRLPRGVQRRRRQHRVDQALDQLQALDLRLYQVIELHVFSGLSLQEVAGELGVTLRTVNRDLLKARALLSRTLGPEAGIVV